MTSSGQAIRFAQNPLPEGIGKVRRSGTPAPTTTTSGLISSDSKESGTPSVSLERQLSDCLREGYILGLDPGAKVSGFAIFDPRTRTIVSLGELHLRRDIKKRMDSRQRYRRTRRTKKWHRPERFSNRARKDGSLPPTMTSKIEAHLHLVKWLARKYPLAAIIIEHGNFDLHAMKENRTSLAGWQYQRGELYGYENVKQMVRIRDDFTCQACLIDHRRKTGKQASDAAYAKIKDRTRQRGIEVGHLTPRGIGPDTANNLCILCHNHNAAQGKQAIEQFGYPELRKQAIKPLKWASHMNIYVPTLIRELRDQGLSVFITRGYITKVNREALGLKKEHYFDAAVIASWGIDINKWPKQYLYTRWMGRKRRQQYRANPVKDGKFVPIQPNAEKDGFRTGDYILYKKNGREERGFIQAIMSEGNARITGIEGRGSSRGIWMLKYLTIIQHSPRLRYEFREL